MTRDWIGNINTGVFWIRNTPWSQQLLREVYRQGIMAPFSRAGGWDNTAFVQLYDSDPAVITRTCVFNTQTLQINCYPHHGQPITKETFALHFAGVADLEQLKRWIDHFSGDSITEKIADFFWYPMFRATLLRRATWIVKVYLSIKSELKPSPAVTASLIRLAWLYHNRGKDAKAKSLFERSLLVQEKILGPDHRSIVELLENYRTHLLEYGHNAEAGELETRAKTIRAKLAE